MKKNQALKPRTGRRPTTPRPLTPTAQLAAAILRLKGYKVAAADGDSFQVIIERKD